MIAMQYTIPFDAHYAMAQIRAHIAKRAPFFDAQLGLALKAFLLNERGTPGRPYARNEYAPFYVWRSVEAARDFLFGDDFQTVCDTFGRPPVRIWQVFRFDDVGPALAARFATLETVGIPSAAAPAEVAATENALQDAALGRPGLHSRAVGFDPELWEIVRFSLWATPEDAARAGVRESHDYEVAHLSAPNAATLHLHSLGGWRSASEQWPGGSVR